MSLLKKPLELLNVVAGRVIEILVNGQTYFGRNIVINESHIVIDGVTVSQNMPQIKVEILGDCESVTTKSGSVYVNQTAGSIQTTSGDVECKHVFGSVSTISGDVDCGDVSGSISTVSGDVHCVNDKG